MSEIDKIHANIGINSLVQNEYKRLLQNPEQIDGVKIDDINQIFKLHHNSPNDLANYILWYYQHLAIKQSGEL